jgi:hypothetical protein
MFSNKFFLTILGSHFSSMKNQKRKTPYWPLEDKSISDLYLDQKNIRIPINAKAQSALIQDLFSNEDAFDLVKSFVQNDLFPDEFPIVVKEKNKLIIIEGNRRLAALKALNEPGLVPSFKEKISALTNPRINNIKVVIAPSRDAAIKHIANKHTINYRRPWKPLRQAYFYKSQLENGRTIDQLKKDFPEHDIPKFIRMLEMHHLAKSEKFDDENLVQKIHDERKFPITNLERMYENPYVQSSFGFSFTEDGQFEGKTSKNEFRKGYRKLLEDITTGIIDSRKTNTSKQIQKYVDDLPKEFKPDPKKKGAFNAKDFKEIKVEKSMPSVRSNRRPTGLFQPGHIPYKLQNSSLKFLYDELRDIDVHDFPNATHDLLRSFLECSLIVYFKQVDEYGSIQKTDQHNPKLGEMLTHIINGKSSRIKDQNIIDVVKQIKTDYDSPYSLERLNMINHNEQWNSSERDVRGAWAKLESLMKIILNPTANASSSK